MKSDIDKNCNYSEILKGDLESVLGVVSAVINPRAEKFRASCRATAAIEFAILAPVFILFLFGIIAYGVYFGASHSIQQLAADAARTAIAGIDEAERQSLADAYIVMNADDYPFVDGTKLQIELRGSESDANQFLVSVRYDASELPIWGLFRDLPLPAMTIAHTATIRIGGI